MLYYILYHFLFHVLYILNDMDSYKLGFIWLFGGFTHLSVMFSLRKSSILESDNEGFLCYDLLGPWIIDMWSHSDVMLYCSWTTGIFAASSLAYRIHLPVWAIKTRLVDLFLVIWCSYMFILPGSGVLMICYVYVWQL